jgi:hypothetical protein
MLRLRLEPVAVSVSDTGVRHRLAVRFRFGVTEAVSDTRWRSVLGKPEAVSDTEKVRIRLESVRDEPADVSRNSGTLALGDRLAIGPIDVVEYPWAQMSFVDVGHSRDDVKVEVSETSALRKKHHVRLRTPNHVTEGAGGSSQEEPEFARFQGAQLVEGDNMPTRSQDQVAGQGASCMPEPPPLVQERAFPAWKTFDVAVKLA